MARALTALTALLAATLGAAAAPGVAQAAQAAKPARAAAAINYVALGDSYSSGVGAGPYDLSTCLRSDKSYAPLWAA
ncbi:hypothetical protein QLR68_29330, partial [Micromonospora sp. DH15]|nr:hypothetical protein [Micromonospora sp. DH15]